MYTLIVVVVVVQTTISIALSVLSIRVHACTVHTLKFASFAKKKKQKASELDERGKKWKKAKKKLFKLLDAKIFQWFHFRIEKGYRDSIWRMVFSFYFILDIYLKYIRIYYSHSTICSKWKLCIAFGLCVLWCEELMLFFFFFHSFYHLKLSKERYYTHSTLYTLIWYSFRLEAFTVHTQYNRKTNCSICIQ